MKMKTSKKQYTVVNYSLNFKAISFLKEAAKALQIRIFMRVKLFESESYDFL